MIAFDLRCDGGHVFEVWFRSSADYEDQRERRLIVCPACGDSGVTKAVMAPHVAAKGNQQRSAPPARAADVTLTDNVPMATGASTLPPQLRAMFAAIAAAQAEALPRSRWVGRDFATEARAMHDGEVEPALIHGQTTRDEAEALIDEGIGVMPLLVPVVPPDIQN